MSFSVILSPLYFCRSSLRRRNLRWMCLSGNLRFLLFLLLPRPGLLGKVLVNPVDDGNLRNQVPHSRAHSRYHVGDVDRDREKWRGRNQVRQTIPENSSFANRRRGPCQGGGIPFCVERPLLARSASKYENDCHQKRWLYNVCPGVCPSGWAFSKRLFTEDMRERLIHVDPDGSLSLTTLTHNSPNYLEWNLA